MQELTSVGNSSPADELEELRTRLADAEEALRAIRSGEVDALVVDGRAAQPQVYTLKSAVEPYRLLIERMAQGALTVTQDGLILFCNESFSRLLKRPRERLLGSDLHDHVAPSAHAILDQLLSIDRHPGRDITLLDDNGDRAEVYVTSAPLSIEDDEMRCLVVTDLSKQALRLRHAAMVEASDDSMYALDHRLQIQTWNRGAERLTGLSPADAIGRDEKTLWPQERRADFEELVRKVQHAGTAMSIDATRQRRDGSPADLIYTLTPLRDRDDQLTGYSVVAHDISDRKQSEAVLREREARVRQLAQVVDNSPDFIGIFDTDGIPIYVNDAGLQLVGSDLDEARRTPVVDYFIAEERPFVRDVVLPQVLGEGQWSGQLHFQHMRTDAAVPVLYNAFRIDDVVTGEPVQFATLTRDLSKEKEVEAHRELLLAELNHRVKNTLATVQAIASHTMRSSGDMQAFQEAFVGRLFAIANAHDIMFKEDVERATLRKLIALQVGPYARVDGGRLKVEGRPAVLGSSTAHSLGLIFHELATNAAKYGALSNQDGRIEINWQDVETPNGACLEINWVEIDGPRVEPTKRSGFGTRLIETTLSHSLGGEAQLQYDPDGLKATLRVPIAVKHD